MEVRVIPKSLRSSAERIKGVAANADRAARTIRMASDNLDISLSGYAVISGKLNGYSEGIEAISRNTKKLGEAGVAISHLYEDADKELAQDEGFMSKVVWGVIGEFGALGSLATAGKDVIYGEYGKVGGTLIDLVGGAVCHDAKPKWYEPFKISEEGFKGEVKEKMASKVAWAAAIAENGWDNYKEHGGLNLRFFEETGVESAIDVGEGALLYAGAAAAVGAAGVAFGFTAPVWAVGAVAAVAGIAVDAGLDWIVKKATGDPDASWKEAASDFICDTGEAIAKEAGKKFNDAVQGIKKFGSRIRWGSFSLGSAGGR